MTLLLDPNNHVDYRLASCLPFEAEQLKYASHCISEKKLSVFLDVGANIGLYTVALGRLPAIQITHSFEPVAANFNQLCANIFLNKLDNKVFSYKLGLGSEPSETFIFIDPLSTGCSRLNPEYSGNKESFTKKEAIKIARLDDILNLKKQRIYMKMDVEGHAVEALRGMKKTLADNYVVIQAELLEYDRDKIIMCLDEMGYVLFSEIDVDGYFCPV